MYKKLRKLKILRGKKKMKEGIFVFGGQYENGYASNKLKYLDPHF